MSVGFGTNAVQGAGANQPSVDDLQEITVPFRPLVQENPFGGNFLGGLFGGLVNNIVPIASTVGGLGALTGAYDRLGSIGERGLVGAGQIAEVQTGL